MIVGYARTSTTEQNAGLEAQARDLSAAGAEKVFSEQVSSVARREQLERAIEFVREGDTLAVTKLDRLARSTADLLALVSRLEGKGVGLLVLSMGGQPVDTGTPTGKLMVTMLGAMAEFERGLMLERQREGIAKAKAEGKYRGRVPTARRQAAEVRAMRAEEGVWRDVVKAWITATLGKGSPVTRWSRKAPAHVAAWNAREVGAAILRKYPFLSQPASVVPSDLSPVGRPTQLLTHFLMALEAVAMTEAIFALKERGILALPIHDGLLVAQENAGEAQEELANAFHKIARVRPHVTTASLRQDCQPKDSPHQRRKVGSQVNLAWLVPAQPGCHRCAPPAAAGAMLGR